MKARRRGTMQKIKRVAFSVILFCLLIAPIIPSTAHSSSIADKQRELDQINNQIGKQRDIIEQKQAEAESLENEIAIMNAEINQLELELEATKVEIAQTNQEIEKKKKELAHQKKILNLNLRMMYEESEVSFLETVLSARSFSDIVNHLEYSSIIKDRIDQAIAKVTKIKQELVKKRKSLETLKAEQEAQSSTLIARKNKKANLLAETRGVEEEYQRLLVANKKKASQVQSEMAAMEAASRGRGGSYVGPPSPFGFQWPTQSHYVCCTYGNACYPGHTGIDIPGTTSTLIYAAADGVVEQVRSDAPGPTRYPSYGNYVLIDHGSGFRTRYAHLSYGGIMISPGQQVSRGQAIAYMGGTGWSMPPGFVHLHFEILYSCIYGCDVNPLQYLP